MHSRESDVSYREDRYLLLVSTSNREPDFSRCSLNFLTRRYSSGTRLRGLPSFWELPRLGDGYASFSGGLLGYELTSSRGDVAARELFHFPTSRKLQHAAIVGKRLVLCYEDELAVFSDWQEAIGQGRLPTMSARRIEDPWFAGLHTVFDQDGRHCIVSSSSADAILRVDLEQASVVARSRLPSEIYGTNYTLSPTDSLRDNFIHNDIQLGHLNCAFPGPDGAVWISTLIQGDIGRFSADGSYERVIGGFVGAHGVRVEHDGTGFYFADSCLGLLMRMNFDGKLRARYEVDSRWLHDVQQLNEDVFLFAQADRNIISIEDVSVSRRMLSIEVLRELGYVQFMNLTPYPERQMA